MAGFYPEETIWSEKIDRSLNSGFIALAEQVFAMTDHGSTVAYKKQEGKIIPEFDTRENTGTFTEKYIQKLYKNIELFAKEYSSFHWLMINARSCIMSCGLNSLYLFTEEPKRSETIIFDQFKIGNNLNDNEKIVTHLTPRIMFRIILWKLNLQHKPHGISWLQGSISYTFGQKGLHLLKAYLKLK
jgi:hypothetical protein